MGMPPYIIPTPLVYSPYPFESSVKLLPSQEMSSDNQSHMDADDIGQQADNVVRIVKLLQEGCIRQQAMDYALSLLITNPDETKLTTVPSPHNFLNSDVSIPMICPAPVPFDIVIHVSPLENDMATFAVVFPPRSPDGRECLLKTGLTVVAQPNFTIAWYLEQAYIMESDVKYIALNDERGVVCYFKARKEWCIEGSREDKIEE